MLGRILLFGFVLLSSFRAEAYTEQHWQTNWCCQKCGQLYQGGDEYTNMTYVMTDRTPPMPKSDCRDGGQCRFIPKRIRVSITKDRVDRYKAQKAEREKKQQK